MIADHTFPIEPWHVRETTLQPEPDRPDRITVRAVERPHRVAGQPRGGRAPRPAGNLPELVLRDPAAAVCRGGLRLSGGRPVRRRRHQRQAPPAARRRRAVRRPLRRIARARTGVGHAGGHPDPRRRWRSPAGKQVRLQVDAAGVTGPAQCRRDRVRGGGGRRIRPRHRAVRARRQRRPARARPTTRGWRPCSRSAEAVRHEDDRQRSASDAPDPARAG